MLVATHSGPFHIDDVFAFALVRTFLAPDATILRTRDLARIAEADLVIDVGGEYDPGRLRFDHHQKSYQGNRSSAGMVLDHLEAAACIPAGLADKLRKEWVDHIDAVDCGRLTPQLGTPGLGAVIGAFAELADSPAEFDRAYLEAVRVCERVLSGLARAEQKTAAAREAVAAAMEAAVAQGSRVLRLDRHYKWKRIYFELGGAGHPTDYVLFPDEDSVRLVAIPPEHGSFAQKRPLPAEWAGLTDDALVVVVGVAGARFCHKNRFIAVFQDIHAAEQAISTWGLT